MAHGTKLTRTHYMVTGENIADVIRAFAKEPADIPDNSASVGSLLNYWACPCDKLNVNLNAKYTLVLCAPAVPIDPKDEWIAVKRAVETDLNVRLYRSKGGYVLDVTTSDLLDERELIE